MSDVIRVRMALDKSLVLPPVFWTAEKRGRS